MAARKRWRRDHVVGWTAIVDQLPGEFYSAAGVPRGEWLYVVEPKRGIPSLEVAQKQADEAVQSQAPHSCAKCGAWEEKQEGLW